MSEENEGGGPFYTTALIPYFQKWAMLKEDIEEAMRELNQLRDYCISAVEQHGERDHKGSQYLTLPFAIGNKGYTQIKREIRHSIQADPEVAELITRSKGVYEKCFPAVPTLDPEELYVQYQLGALSQEDMDAIFVDRVSFSFKPLA